MTALNHLNVVKSRTARCNEVELGTSLVLRLHCNVIWSGRSAPLINVEVSPGPHSGDNKSKWKPILAKFEGALVEASSEGKPSALGKHSSRQLLGESRRIPELCFVN